jgi:hypothetical protein
MFTAQKKIKKQAGSKPDELEGSVAQALFELETNVPDLKADLKDLYISAAKEVSISLQHFSFSVFCLLLVSCAVRYGEIICENGGICAKWLFLNRICA